MYAAILNNQLVYAQDFDKIFEKQNANFRCAKCGEKVVYVKSAKSKSYFRHSSPEVRSNETIEHFYGKKTIKSGITTLGANAKLEVPLAHDQLRADVLITLSNRKIALEFQCAPISIIELSRRHELYKQENIVDLWILGQRHFMTKNIHQIHLFILKENLFWRCYLIEIDVFKHQIILKYNILKNDLNTQVSYQKRIFSLDEYGISQLIRFRPRKFSTRRNSAETNRLYLEKQVRQKTKLGLTVAKKCYQLRISLADLPDEFFVGYRNPLLECQLLVMLNKKISN